MSKLAVFALALAACGAAPPAPVAPAPPELSVGTPTEAFLHVLLVESSVPYRLDDIANRSLRDVTRLRGVTVLSEPSMIAMFGEPATMSVRPRGVPIDQAGVQVRLVTDVDPDRRVHVGVDVSGDATVSTTRVVGDGERFALPAVARTPGHEAYVIVTPYLVHDMADVERIRGWMVRERASRR